MKFKSEIPQMISKLEFMKSKNEKMMKEELEVYGFSELPNEDYDFIE